MINFKQKKYIIILSLISIFILALFSSLSFFDKDKMIIGLDEWSVLRPSFRLEDWSSTWASSSSLGRDLSARIVNLPTQVLPYFLMEKAGISIVNSQKLFYLSIFLISAFSMYFLALTLWEKKYLLAFIAAITYMFNPVVGGYWASLLVPAIFCLAVSPLILAIFIKGLKSKNKLFYSVAFSFSTLLFPMVNPPLFAILGMILFAFLLYFSIKDRQFKNNLFFVIGCLFFFVLVNFWWILNLARTYLSTPDFMESGDSLTRLASSSYTSSFLNLFRFQTNYWGFSYWGDKVNNWIGFLMETNPLMIIGTFLLSVLAFSSLILAKGDLLVSFLSLLSLLFIFLGKGLHAPFGSIYQKIFNLPFFNMFRTPSQKFPMGVILLFSLLIGVAVNEIYVKFSKKDRKASVLITGIIIFTLLFNQWYFFTGDALQRGKSAQPSVLVKFPQYYWDAADWLSGQKDFFRLFTLPGSNIPTNWLIYKWGFLGLYSVPSEIFMRPVVDKLPLDNYESFRWGAYALFGNYAALPQEYLKIFPSANVSRLLRLMSVKYILVNKDYDWQHLYYGNENVDIISSLVSMQNGASFEKSFGSLDFYKVDNSLPLISVSSATQQLLGNNLSLSQLADFSAWEPEKGTFSDKSILTDRVFIVPEFENEISQWNKNQIYVDFAFSRWSPDSPFYPMVIGKEDQQLQNTTDSNKKFELELELSGKRVYEIQQWGATLSDDKFNEILNRYKSEMISASGILQTDLKDNLLQLLPEYKNYLDAQQVRLLQVCQSMTDAKKIQVILALDAIFENSQEDFSKLDYSVSKSNFTVKNKGIYSIFLRKEKGANYKSEVNFGINGKTKPVSDSTDSNWVKLGEEQLESGPNSIDLKISSKNNLLKLGNQIKFNIFDQPFLCDSIDTFSNRNYRLQFDYDLKSFNRLILLVEGDPSGQNSVVYKTLLRGGIDKTRHFETIFRSGPFAKSLYFCWYQNSNPDFKILAGSATSIFEPLVVINSGNLLQSYVVPKINFERISPTEYNISISDAKAPYVLIFSETFSKEWQAIIDGKLISESKHELINGFANSWLIEPSDSNGQENYKIILKYRPQKLLVWSVYVSAISFLICLVYLIYFIFFKKYVKKSD